MNLHVSSRLWRVLPPVFFVCAVFLITAHTLIRVNVPGEPGLETQNGLQDFRDAVYYPVRALLDGRNPYDPSEFLRHYPVASAFPLYSPALLTLHLPFGLLSHGAAQLAYYGLHLALLPLFAGMALRMAGVRASLAQVLSLSALLLLSRPGHHNAFLGQCTLYVAIGTYAALRWGASRAGLAAWGFALTTIKPTYALPLGILLLCRAQIRPVMIGTLLGVVAAVPAAILLFGSAASLPALLRENLAAFSSNRMVDPTTSLYRLDVAVPFAQVFGAGPDMIAQLALALVVLVPAGLAVRRLDKIGDDRSRRAANEVACLAILTSFYHLTYDGILLALPATALVLGTSGLAPAERPLARWTLAALLAVPALNYVATETAGVVFLLDRSTLLRIAAVSAGACVAAFALGLMLAWTRVARRASATDDAGRLRADRPCLPI